MSCKAEFETVDALLRSTAKTRGVDAFCLAVIKAERQIRRLVTHLVFQYPCFSTSDAPQLRSTLASARDVYFEGLIRAFDALYPKSIESLVGDAHSHLKARLTQASGIRNKIFHGQVTDQNLTRAHLVSYVSDVRAWCEVVAQACHDEIGYDGFARNSLRKVRGTALSEGFKIQLQDIQSYQRFIKNTMRRSRS